MAGRNSRIRFMVYHFGRILYADPTEIPIDHCYESPVQYQRKIELLLF